MQQRAQFECRCLCTQCHMCPRRSSQSANRVGLRHTREMAGQGTFSYRLGLLFWTGRADPPACCIAWSIDTCRVVAANGEGASEPVGLVLVAHQWNFRHRQQRTSSLPLHTEKRPSPHRFPGWYSTSWSILANERCHKSDRCVFL